MTTPPPDESAAQRRLRGHAAQHAIRVLMAYDLARRGLLPLSRLERAVDPRVLDQVGPTPPPPVGVPLGPARIGGLHVQLAGDRNAHVSAVAHTPDGAATGYILQLARDGAARPWLVTELSRVQDRHLVGPDTTEDITDRRTTRLPRDLDGLIRATEHARNQAAAALTHAEQRRAALADQPRHTVRQRTAHDRAEADADRDIHRWRSRLDDIDDELAELHDVVALRRVRTAVKAGDPLVSPRLGQLQVVLGTVPDNRHDRDEWLRLSRRLLDYAVAWNVNDLPRDLIINGSRHDGPGQDEDRHALRAIVNNYRGTRDLDPLGRVGAERLRPGDQVIDYRAPERTLTFQATDPDTGRAILTDNNGICLRHTPDTMLWQVRLTPDTGRDRTTPPHPRDPGREEELADTLVASRGPDGLERQATPSPPAAQNRPDRRDAPSARQWQAAEPHPAPDPAREHDQPELEL